MKKAIFLLIIILTSFSCFKKKEVGSEKIFGDINTISVIIDDQLWNGEIGDSIRNKFASPVIGLPKEEPLFTINQYPVKLLEGFINNTRNSIVVKKEQRNEFRIVSNKNNSSRNIFYISGKTTALILEKIESNASDIIRKIHESEIEAKQQIIDTSKINTSKINKKFNIDLHIPKGYKYVLEKKKFIWLKKEITSGNTSVLIYQFPLNHLKRDKNLINSIIRKRDSIGSLYIRGTAKNSQMITEYSYSPYIIKTNIKGKETLETKGTWELKNDYMSGPFINYTIIDRTNKRILVLEGFCYDPSKEKRDLMFELEAIIKSIEFLKKKK